MYPMASPQSCFTFREIHMGVRIFEDKIPIDQEAYTTAVEFKLIHSRQRSMGEKITNYFTIRQADFEKSRTTRIFTLSDISMLTRMRMS